MFKLSSSITKSIRNKMKNLKELRERKRLTQVDVSIYCGISISLYRLIEYGAQRPNPEVLKKLEKLLYE